MQLSNVCGRTVIKDVLPTTRPFCDKMPRSTTRARSCKVPIIATEQELALGAVRILNLSQYAGGIITTGDFVQPLAQQDTPKPDL
jgi:hypothetical protein